VHISLHLAGLALLSVSAKTEVALDGGLAGRPAGAERAIWASERLVGARYVLSPLGEGEGPDPDPRFRLDAFDCVTFVETAIALGNSTSTAEAARLLDDIRYDGPPDYAHRDHYVEAQWLPANLRKGWLAEATRAVAGPLAERAEKRLTRSGWKAAEKAGRVLPDLPPERRPMGTFAFDLVPLARVPEIAPRIPPGTVLLVVREDRPWRPYRVTHMGVVVAGPRGERLLRHASDAPGALRVRDERLDHFLARNARYGAWPVSGVSLYSIRDNAARARALLSGGPSSDRPPASAAPRP
jgi:Protein of unknown function (DUF1460)